MKRFDGKKAYISGGTSGIGLAIAELLAKLGADLFLFSLDSDEQVDKALSSVRGSFSRDDQAVEFARADVTDREAVQALLAGAAGSFGAPDIVVNSAGIGGGVLFENLSYERFDRTIKINLYGTRNVVASLLPFMKSGHIVNVASFSGLVGLPGYTAYGTSKFAVVGFSLSLRSEVKQKGVSVHVLCPPQVDTPLLRETDKDKPPQTKALNDKGGVLSARFVASEMLRGIRANKAVIVPGKKTKLFWFIERFAPSIREKLADRTIEKVLRKK